MTESGIWCKLIEIQRDLKAPKNQYNSHGNYKYRSAEDIIEAAKPLCHERGLALLIDEEIVEVGGRVFIVSRAEVTDGNESISRKAHAEHAREQKGMNAAQISGSTESYAKKYALCNLFALDDTKDPDYTNDQKKSQAQKVADRGQDSIAKARASLNAAIERWAKATHADAKKAKAGIKKRPDYEPTEEFYSRAADEFATAAKEAEDAR